MIYKLALLALAACSSFAQDEPRDQDIEAEIMLTTAAEVLGGTPLQTPSQGSGVASINYQGSLNRLTYQIEFEGLTSNTTQAHFHGPAPADGTAGVVITISAGQFDSGFSGTMSLNAIQQTDIINGMWYVNIHTEDNPMGELRGQVILQAEPGEILIVQQATIGLTTEAEELGGTRLAVPSGGIGSATVQVTTEAPYVVSWAIDFQDLTGQAAAAHFHGPASQTGTAGVEVIIAGEPFLPPHTGAVEITLQQAQNLMNGQWYINIHTAANPAGEIRGQVQNFETVELMVEGAASTLSATVAVVMSIAASLVAMKL